MNTQNIINVSRICTGNNTIRTAWYDINISSNIDPSDTKIQQNNKQTIKTVSAGRLGLKGARRGTPYAAELVGRELGKVIESKHQKYTIVVYRAGKIVALASALRGLRQTLEQNEITNLIDVSPKPHNGCRARKPRRV